MTHAKTVKFVIVHYMFGHMKWAMLGLATAVGFTWDMHIEHNPHRHDILTGIAVAVLGATFIAAIVGLGDALICLKEATDGKKPLELDSTRTGVGPVEVARIDETLRVTWFDGTENAMIAVTMSEEAARDLVDKLHEGLPGQ